ncbi:putative ribonuclease H-like domain-containing protein [Tanacetum coccineum]
MDYIKLLDLGDILLVQVYVYDIIFGSTKKELCHAFEKLMHEKFQMSSMGELTFFLRLKVKQKKDGIFISQDKYVDEILKKFRFIKVKTASTPIETQKPLLKDEDGEEVDVHMYRSMISSLMYLTSSRLDIMFAVCAYAKYQVNPKISHLYVVKRIFRHKLNTARLLLLVKVNAARHNLLLLVKVNAARHNLLLLGYYCWAKATVKAKTINGEVQLQALVDGKKIIITESTVRRDLQLEDVEGVDCLPNATIFEQLALMGKPKRKDTQIPQSSNPTEHIADEAVHKERGDSLVRVATTASSLETKQDSGNTLQSGEDRLKLKELMELCTNLQQRVLDLEKIKTTQAKEIVNLKRKINAIDADEDITLVNDQDDPDMFDVNTLTALAALKSVKPKVKANVVEEPSVPVSAASTKDKGKGILVEEPVKPKKKDLIRLDVEIASKLQVEFDEKERLARVKDEANVALTEEWDDIQAKVDVDYQLAQRLQAQEQE